MEQTVQKRESLFGFFKDTVIYSFGTLFSRGLNIILTVILTRLFIPAQFGIINLIQTTITFMIAVISLQMESAVLRYYHETDNKKLFISTHLFTVVLFSMVACSILIINSEKLVLWLFKDIQIKWTFIFSIIIIPPALIFQHILTTLMIIRKAKKVIFISIINSMITIGLTIFFIAQIKLGIMSVFIARIISDLFLSIIVLLIRQSNYCFGYSLKVLKKILLYCIPLLPAIIASFVLVHINEYILLFFGGITLVAIFGVSQTIASVIELATSTLKQSWPSYAFSIMKDGFAKDAYAKIFKLYFKIMSVIIILLIIFSKEIVLIFTTKDYLGASKIIGFMGGNIIFQGATILVNIGSIIKDKTYCYTIGIIFSAILNVLLSIWLIPKIGIMGAAISMFISHFVLVLIVLYFSQKNYYIKFDIRYLYFFVLLVVIFVYLNNTLFCNLFFSHKLFITMLLLGLFFPFFSKELSFYRTFNKNRVKSLNRET